VKRNTLATGAMQVLHLQIAPHIHATTPVAGFGTRLPAPCSVHHRLVGAPSGLHHQQRLRQHTAPSGSSRPSTRCLYVCSASRRAADPQDAEYQVCDGCSYMVPCV
jgi:hypothetical protein